MQEFIKLVQDVGIYLSIMILILFLGFKYLPQYIELKLKRIEEKDVLLDAVKSVIDNNTNVIANNSEVIQMNSETIKNYTNNSHKLEDKIGELTKEVSENNKLIHIQVLQDRK